MIFNIFLNSKNHLRLSITFWSKFTFNVKVDVVQPIYTIISTKDNHVNVKWSWKPTNPHPYKSIAISNPNYTHTTIPKTIENLQTHRLTFTQKTHIIRPQKMIVTHICTPPKNCIEIMTWTHKFLLQIRDFKLCFQCNFVVCNK